MISRRSLLLGAGCAPAIVRAQKNLPHIPFGAMAGDVRHGRAIVWSRADRPARMRVTWRTSERGESREIHGPHCLDVTDFTGRAELTGLPAGQTILYEVRFEDLRTGRLVSDPLSGRFRTPGSGVRFLWAGDTAGQGWGINPDWGGMRTYEAMRRLEPDFFIHSGDTIYADGPIQREVTLPDGSLWKNVVTEEKSKVAETLDEFRGNHRYNLMDANVRRFNWAVAQIWQWDDHEVTNNWSGTKELDDRYRERSVPLLVARATRAFLEYAPMRLLPAERIYRRIPYGPLCDVFVVDMRSYRGPNTFNRETAETPFLGRPQLDWLSRGLQASQATWKVIAADMPIGLQVGDGKDAHGRPRFENLANGDGPPLGREIEMARLLRSIRDVKNVVWFTADTHYTAAHFYNPAKARFTEFSPFWEFMSGPLHAGTFGPSQTDDTFGIEVVYQKHCTRPNMAPSEGMQFFGDVRIDAKTREMSVVLRDLTGAALFTKTLDPA